MRLRIGTRRSKLALAQAKEVAHRLAAAGVEAELVPIVTSGDRGEAARTGEAGVKGLFVAEIVHALQSGAVDVAVHSAKDLPAQDPRGVVVAAVPEREDPFDVLVSRGSDLSPGSVVGTSSLRRSAQLTRARRDVRIRALRGNVDTRLEKLQAGEVDAIVLASAGLRRLGVSPPHARSLPLEEMVPAPGQGALAVQAREDDAVVRDVMRRLDAPSARTAFEAERALVAAVGGDCSLPLGAYAESRDGSVRLVAVVVTPDGREAVWAESEAAAPDEVAGEVSQQLLAGGAAAILERSMGEVNERDEGPGTSGPGA